MADVSDPSYRRQGLVLGRGSGVAAAQAVRDLQRDLRRLGYLREGIDGRFGTQTERAVRSLRYDLLFNDGLSTGGDGPAPVRLIDMNRGRVSTAALGEVDQPLAECIVELLENPLVPSLPSSEHPVEENRRVLAALSALPSEEAPTPFLMAIFEQESGLRHFHEPGPGDEDTFIVVGFDRSPGAGQQIVSRGYGIGQYTLFHHPPRREEVDSFMRRLDDNVRQSARELGDKFDHFLLGSTEGTRAEDRRAEIGIGPLRRCRYPAEDLRHKRDCRACARDAGMMEIRSGETALYPGSGQVYVSTPLYPQASFSDVPRRAMLGCDWPYAARRYNGSGIDSYHYQVRVLRNLLAGPAALPIS